VKEMLKIKVPATSANLGPGYDSFGLALNLFNEYEFEIKKEVEKLSINIIDNKEKDINLKKEDNLILNTIKYLQGKYPDKINTQGLHIKAKINYPLNRGLGSSANAIVGTIIGLNNLYSLGIDNKTILSSALDLEGHPDNIVPTLIGGFTISKVENGKIIFEKFNVGKEIKILLFIPDLAIKTKDARRVVDKSVNIKNASQNIANASLITAGLINSNLELIKKGSKDYIHQTKRLALNTKLENIFFDLQDRLNCPYFLSGSGSTLIFLSKKDFRDEKEIINKMAVKFKIVNYLIETEVNNKGIIINKDGDKSVERIN